MKFADIQAAYKPREKRVAVVLDGALLGEHEAASARLEDALAARRTSLSDPGATELAEQVQALEAAIRDATVEFTVVGLGKNAYRRLVAQHTISADDDERLDMDAFIPALLTACIREPADVDVDWLMDNLGDGQIDDLFGAAFRCCREADGVPFNQLASAQIAG